MGSNNKSVKIRILIGSLDVGGTETHLVRLLPELVVSGIEPVIITLTHKGFLAVELEKLNISVFSPPMIIRVLQRFPLISRLTAPLVHCYICHLYLNVIRPTLVVFICQLHIIWECWRIC